MCDNVLNLFLDNVRGSATSFTIIQYIITRHSSQYTNHNSSATNCRGSASGSDAPTWQNCPTRIVLGIRPKPQTHRNFLEWRMTEALPRTRSVFLAHIPYRVDGTVPSGQASQPAGRPSSPISGQLKGYIDLNNFACAWCRFSSTTSPCCRTPQLRSSSCTEAASERAFSRTCHTASSACRGGTVYGVCSVLSARTAVVTSVMICLRVCVEVEAEFGKAFAVPYSDRPLQRYRISRVIAPYSRTKAQTPFA